MNCRPNCRCPPKMSMTDIGGRLLAKNWYFVVPTFQCCVLNFAGEPLDRPAVNRNFYKQGNYTASHLKKKLNDRKVWNVVPPKSWAVVYIWICTTFHRYPIFSKRYSVLCKVYIGYCGTSEIEHGLCACTVDNPLAKARGLSLRTGAQTMLYIPLRVPVASVHPSHKRTLKVNGYTSQRANDVKMTSNRRRFVVITSHWCQFDVIMTSCACWVSGKRLC